MSSDSLLLQFALVAACLLFLAMFWPRRWSRRRQKIAYHFKHPQELMLRLKNRVQVASRLVIRQVASFLP
jgi:hypothetical protein